MQSVPDPTLHDRRGRCSRARQHTQRLERARIRCRHRATRRRLCATEVAMSYPVTFDVVRPERWSRAQLALRLVLFVVIGMLGFSLGALFLLLYIGLPAFAALSLSNESAEGFLEHDAPAVVKVLRWVMAIYAYFGLLTDRPPTIEPERDVHLEAHPEGHPTVASALLRILYGLPSAIVLSIVMWVAALAWLIAFVLVLVHRRYGRWLFEFQTGVLRWMARLLLYQASLVAPYPPFSLSEAAPPPVHA
jgi:uncharacterized protein DUF4389